MTTDVDKVALTIFVAFFVLVTVMGFIAARWRRPKTLARLDEWGLGGRQFGTWITWFLVGGDFYTAYTVIAVPALVYAVGAYGFFALPYTIIVYPFVFAVMPVLWRVAKANGYVTAADVVHGRYGSRALELAVAITGVIATMPYIALQLVGMAAVFKALGLAGELPLVTAFVVLAVYTYSSGLRAPALIAFVKDTMIYIAVFAAVAVIPSRLGGYGAVFQAADAAFRAKGIGPYSARPRSVSTLRDSRLRIGARCLHVSAHSDRRLRERQRQHHPQERGPAPGLYAAARSLGASRLYGPRGRLDAFQQQRCRPGPVQGAVPGLVCRLCLCRHRNRRLGPGGSHEHRRGQPVHTQFLEGLCQSRDQRGGRGTGRQGHIACGESRSFAGDPLSADTICTRSAAVGRLVDPPNVSGGGVRTVCRVVHGTRAPTGLAGWIPGRHVAGLVRRVEAAAYGRVRQHRVLVVCRVAGARDHIAVAVVANASLMLVPALRDVKSCGGLRSTRSTSHVTQIRTIHRRQHDRHRSRQE